jgi:hypothetical protein
MSVACCARGTRSTLSGTIVEMLLRSRANFTNIFLSSFCTQKVQTIGVRRGGGSCPPPFFREPPRKKSPDAHGTNLNFKYKKL